MNIEPWRPSLTPSKLIYNEGWSVLMMPVLSRRYRRAVAESTTIILVSVWGLSVGTVDIVIETVREFTQTTGMCFRGKEAVLVSMMNQFQ